MSNSLLKFCFKFFSNNINLGNDYFVYCFAHNQVSLNSIISTLKKYNINSIYLINNKVKMSGVENYEFNRNFYENNGINVCPIDYHNSIIQTKIESIEIIKFIIKNNIKKIILIAPIFHILRASLTFISTAIDYNCSLKIISILDNNCLWQNKYITHQGKNESNVDILIDDEINRINKYTQKGDIKDIQTIINYIDSN